MIWHVLGILAFVVIYNIWRYYHEDDDYDYSPVVTETSENNQVAETVMEETISTRQLALNTIEKIWVRTSIHRGRSYPVRVSGCDIPDGSCK